MKVSTTLHYTISCVCLCAASKMAAVKCVHATREDLESIRSEFALLLTTLCDTSKEAQDKAEQEVMNQ